MHRARASAALSMVIMQCRFCCLALETQAKPLLHAPRACTLQPQPHSTPLRFTPHLTPPHPYSPTQWLIVCCAVLCCAVLCCAVLCCALLWGRWVGGLVVWCNVQIVRWCGLAEGSCAARPNHTQSGNRCCSFARSTPQTTANANYNDHYRRTQHCSAFDDTLCQRICAVTHRKHWFVLCVVCCVVCCCLAYSD